MAQAQRGNRGAAELLLAAKADAMLADLNGVAPVFAAARPVIWPDAVGQHGCVSKPFFPCVP